MTCAPFLMRVEPFFEDPHSFFSVQAFVPPSDRISFYMMSGLLNPGNISEFQLHYVLPILPKGQSPRGLFCIRGPQVVLVSSLNGKVRILLWICPFAEGR